MTHACAASLVALLLTVMRILFVSPQLPHRNRRSGHAIIHQRVRRLAARGHEVGLACFVSETDRPYLEEMREGLLALETLPPPARRPAPVRWWHAFRDPPLPFRRFLHTPMAALVGDMVERDEYQVVIAEFSEMGPFLWWNPRLPAVRTVLSCHQCVTIASQKRCDLLGYSPAGLLERWKRDRIQRYEFQLYRAMDRVLVLTPQERWQMLNYAPELRMAVVPYGVDVEAFHPVAEGSSPSSLVFTGFYSDEPNRDAVRWFIERVWPRVVALRPDTTFYVVGPDPTPAMLALTHTDPRIVVTGKVPDVREYLNRAAVFVCPVRMGSGMRGKILEAMACGTAVVTTTLGAEGIPAVPGENCLLADDPELMAAHIDLLLGDAVLRGRLAESARRMVVERLSWDVTVRRLEETLAEVLEH